MVVITLKVTFFKANSLAYKCLAIWAASVLASVHPSIFHPNTDVRILLDCGPNAIAYISKSSLT